MSIKNSESRSEPHLSPHTRLALSVIESAVKDIKLDDASLHGSAARFLKGSEDYYFWARALDQDSDWLLRALHVRLRHDSPRAYERLAPVGGSPSRTAGWERHKQVLSGELASR